MKLNSLRYLLFAFFLSCALELPEEGKMPRWSTIIQIPLAEEEITLSSLVDDTLIVVDGLDNYFENSSYKDSIFVYQKQISIEKVEVGDRIKIDPISTSFSQSIEDVSINKVEKKVSSKVGTISLEDMEPTSTDPFIFKEIYPNIENTPDGQSAAISAFEISPITNPFTFEDFSNAEFENGLLLITIENNMVIPLGPPLNIQLLSANGSDTTSISGGFVQFDTVINANGGVASETLDLSSVTLPGNIFVQVSGECQGTSGIQIPINEDSKNSSFLVKISGSDLKVSSATAKIPQQSINEFGLIQLDPDSNKVVRATIQHGNLNIRVDNYMDLESVLNVSIPGLESPSGLEFETSIEIAGSATNILDLNDVAGYVLVMDPDNQSLTYNYSVLTIDSGNELIALTSDDSILVEITLEGLDSESDITFSQFEGFLEQDAMIDSSTIFLDSHTKVDQADIKEGKLVLDIENGIGVEAIVNFKILEFVRNGAPLDTSFLLKEGPLSVPIELSDYKMDLDHLADSQVVNYFSIIDIPSDEMMSLSFGQSIEIDVRIDTMSFSNISGFIDPVFVEIDTFQNTIDIPNDLDDLDFSKIDMEFSFTSSMGLPVYLDLELKSFNDDNGESIVRSLSEINITENPIFTVDSAQELINIKPNRIIASGSARIGSLDVYGSVSSTDTLLGNLNIAAPLAFDLGSGSKIDIEPRPLESISLDDVKSVKVFLDYGNEFEFGADVNLLISPDTLKFDSGSADTLAFLSIKNNSIDKDSILLDESKLSILNNKGNYTKAFINLNSDGEGPARFLSTDTMNINMYISLETIIDPSKKESGN